MNTREVRGANRNLLTDQRSAATPGHLSETATFWLLLRQQEVIATSASSSTCSRPDPDPYRPAFDPVQTRLEPDIFPALLQPFSGIFPTIKTARSLLDSTQPFWMSKSMFLSPQLATCPPLKTWASSFICWFQRAAPPHRSPPEASATSICEFNLVDFDSSQQIFLFSARAISLFHTHFNP